MTNNSKIFCFSIASTIITVIAPNSIDTLSDEINDDPFVVCMIIRINTSQEKQSVNNFTELIYNCSYMAIIDISTIEFT